MREVIVIGSGLAGSTVARYLAEVGYKVQVLEKNMYPGGMVQDHMGYQQHGIHIFHTNNKAVWEWITKFSRWKNYEHQVIGKYFEREIPLPISQRSLAAVYGDDHNYPYPAKKEYTSAYDYLTHRFGAAYTDVVFKHYSKKQWGIPLQHLPASIVQRITVRNDYRLGYFTDKYQVLPTYGYSSFITNMLDHTNIDLQCGTSWDMSIYNPRVQYFYSGCIGELTDYPLPYRYVKIDIDHKEQHEVVVNHLGNDISYTRTYASGNLPISFYYKGIRCNEYTTSEDGLKAYPMPWLVDMKAVLKEVPNNITPIGRLGLYRYMNMDGVIASSLKTAKEYANG